METIIIKSVLSSGALLLGYHLLLQKEKLFHFNRFYLLFSILFSLALPFLSIEVAEDAITAPAVNLVQLSKLTDISPEQSIHSDENANTEWVGRSFLVLYFLIAGMLLIRLIRNFQSVNQLAVRNPHVVEGDVTLVLLPENSATFTFLNYVFLNETAFQENRIEADVLTHEFAHANQKHSLDILTLEFIQVVCWFNPFVYFYKKAIQLNHEFLADNEVLKIHADPAGYQQLLVQKAIDGNERSLTSNFYYSITKKRIQMIGKKINRPNAAIKQIVALFFLAGITLLACEKKENDMSVSKQLKIQHLEEIFWQEPKHGQGISEREMKGFQADIEASTKHFTGKNKKEQIVLNKLQQKKMLLTFERMTRRQQVESGIKIRKMPELTKKSPSPDLFERMKNPEAFRIWLDGKRIPNTELNKMKCTDIALFDLQQMGGTFNKTRTYTYETDLQTHEYFEEHLQRMDIIQPVSIKSVSLDDF